MKMNLTKLVVPIVLAARADITQHVWKFPTFAARSSLLSPFVEPRPAAKSPFLHATVQKVSEQVVCHPLEENGSSDDQTPASDMWLALTIEKCVK